jgi:hypothetical protein
VKRKLRRKKEAFVVLAVTATLSKKKKKRLQKNALNVKLENLSSTVNAQNAETFWKKATEAIYAPVEGPKPEQETALQRAIHFWIKNSSLS